MTLSVSRYDSQVQNDAIAGDRPLHTGWGGARPGAGAPTKDRVKSTDQKDLDHHKARHEKVKADLAELDYRTKVGELVSRAAVTTASATMLATFAQSMRTIPDSLERKFALAPEITEAIGRDIDDSLDAMADLFAMMTTPPAAPAAPDA